MCSNSSKIYQNGCCQRFFDNRIYKNKIQHLFLELMLKLEQQQQQNTYKIQNESKVKEKANKTNSLPRFLSHMLISKYRIQSIILSL